jgi:hypothetical protein
MTSHTTPGDGPALVRVLHQHTVGQLHEATVARHRHRLLTAAAIDPSLLSQRGQRTLAELSAIDDMAIDGLVEILFATRSAALMPARRDDARRPAVAAVDPPTNGQMTDADARAAAREMFRTSEAAGTPKSGTGSRHSPAPTSPSTAARMANASAANSSASPPASPTTAASSYCGSRPACAKDPSYEPGTPSGRSPPTRQPPVCR